MQCDDCHHHFLIKPEDLINKDEIYCSFCGKTGDLLIFTNSIREIVFEKRHFKLPEGKKIEHENKPLSLEEISEIINNLDTEDIDVFEYHIDEIIDESKLITYEYICCDHLMKIPMDDYQDVQFCPFCKAEVLLNITD